MLTEKQKEKLNELKTYINNLDNVAIAFSGGVDSTLLLKISVEVLGKEKVLAVTSCSETYPSEEFEDAKKLVEKIGAKHHVIYSSELDNDDFAQNDKNRCYYCKKELFSEIKEVAAEKGYDNVLDGSNYDDKINDYRPGLKAVKELDVKSPLKEAKLTKKDIRAISKKYDLSTWNKPSFACLSSRFPYGQRIEPEILEKVDEAERFLRKYNFNQLRLRHHDEETARIEVLPEDMNTLMQNKGEIIDKLKELGYTYITMDLEGYRTGSMNEVLNL
ncbi:MAG: ATP-dependent sacrificial sulfur transferase LarE [Halanaerobiaceae bacterium]